MIAECASPGCTNTGGNGYHFRLFCRAHAALLAEIRAAFEAEEPTAAQTVGRTITPRAA